MVEPSLPPELLDAIASVQRRTRAQGALAAVTRCVPVCAGALAVVTLLDRAHLLPAEALSTGLWLGSAALVLAALVGGWRRPSAVAAAQRIDRVLQTEDRLAAAVDFSGRAATDAWMRAAIHDATGRLGEGAAQAATPFRAPAHGRPALWALGAWILASMVVFPAGEIPGEGLAALRVPGGFELRAAKLDVEAQEELADQEAALEPVAEGQVDSRVDEAIEELNALIRNLRSGDVRLETAHQRLANLEARLAAFDKASGEDAERELARAQKAGKSRRKTGRDINPLLEALREAKWREAAEALEAMNPRGAKAQRQLGRDLDQLAKRLESERARQRRKHEESRRRLQKKQKEGRLTANERRRLERDKRALQRLRREEARAGETGRRLQRLERALQSAAQDLLRRSSGQPMSQEAMKRAAEALRRLSKDARSRKRMRMVAARSESIRELLRRAARRAAGDKDPSEDGRERFFRLARGDGDPSGEGKKGGGEDGEKITLLTPSRGGSVRVTTARAGGASSTGAGQGQGQGDGAGSGHDPNLLGKAERLDVRTKDVSVSGEHGAGGSKTRVVASAARRGFATRGWKRVHQDYRHVVEERMERQAIPPGHRRYVRRYFDLIRPR